MTRLKILRAWLPALIIVISIVGGHWLQESYAVSLPGASTATCSPSPCTNPGAWGSSYNLSVKDSDGADALTVTRSFSIFKPSNLTGSPPLVVDLGGTQSNFFQLATDNRFVAILLPNNYHGGQYAEPVIQAAAQPSPNAYGPQTCGSSGTSQCDDIPWLKAALSSVMCSGAAPCLNVDSSRVYVLGGSKGGAFTTGAICDTRTNNYFTAAMVVSNNLISANYSGSQSVAGNCPAILGTSNGFGGAPGLAPNKNISIGWEFGTNDTSACAAASGNNACLDTGYTDAKPRWQFSDNQLAGDANPPSPGAAAGSLVGFGHALGCQNTPSTDTIYGNTGKLRKRIYANCSSAGRATQTIKVTGGGHSFPGMDGVDGFNGEAEAWTLFASYGGPISGGGGGSSSSAGGQTSSGSGTKTTGSTTSGSNSSNSQTVKGVASDNKTSLSAQAHNKSTRYKEAAAAVILIGTGSALFLKRRYLIDKYTKLISKSLDNSGPTIGPTV